MDSGHSRIFDESGILSSISLGSSACTVPTSWTLQQPKWIGILLTQSMAYQSHPPQLVGEGEVEFLTLITPKTSQHHFPSCIPAKDFLKQEILLEIRCNSSHFGLPTQHPCLPVRTCQVEAVSNHRDNNNIAAIANNGSGSSSSSSSRSRSSSSSSSSSSRRSSSSGSSSRVVVEVVVGVEE